jgi:hypothetical protein
MNKLQNQVAVAIATYHTEITLVKELCRIFTLNSKGTAEHFDHLAFIKAVFGTGIDYEIAKFATNGNDRDIAP